MLSRSAGGREFDERACVAERWLACNARRVPYRDAAPRVHAPQAALTAAARLLGVHGIAQVLFHVAASGTVLLAQREMDQVISASEHGGPRPETLYWGALSREPFWPLAPIPLAGIVLLAGVLLALRMRGLGRVLGAVAVALAIVVVAVAGTNAMQATPATPAVDYSAMLTSVRGLEALLAVAQVPILWALSRPGARTFAWLTTACAAGMAYAAFGDVVRGHDLIHLSSSARLVKGLVIPGLDTLPFLFAGVAGWLPRREDLRGPPPEPALSRAIYAIVATAIPIAAFALFGGLFAGLGEPLRTWTFQPFAFRGVECIAPFAYASLLVGAVAMTFASRAVSPRLIPIVVVMAVASAVFGFLPAKEPEHAAGCLQCVVVVTDTPVFDMRHFAWTLSASVLLFVAAWLVRGAAQQTERAAAALGGDPISLSAATAARALTPRLVGCALSTASSLSSVLLGFALGRPGFLLAALFGAAALVSAATLGRGLRARMGWLAELARRQRSNENP